MMATQRIINYIRRDELTHVTLFANIMKEIKKEFPDFFREDIIYDMFTTAVEQEIKWSNHILKNDIIGMNVETTEQYTKWLANERLQLLGMQPLYKNFTENPYKHLDRMQDSNMEK